MAVDQHKRDIADLDAGSRRIDRLDDAHHLMAGGARREGIVLGRRIVQHAGVAAAEREPACADQRMAGLEHGLGHFDELGSSGSHDLYGADSILSPNVGKMIFELSHREFRHRQRRRCHYQIAHGSFVQPIPMPGDFPSNGLPNLSKHRGER